MAEIKIVLDAAKITESLAKLLDPGCILMPHDAVCRLLNSHQIGEDELIASGGIKSTQTVSASGVVDE